MARAAEDEVDLRITILDWRRLHEDRIDEDRERPFFSLRKERLPAWGFGRIKR